MPDPISTITLRDGDTVALNIDGLLVYVTAEREDDGCPSVALAGATCNLEGDLPGHYVLTPLS